MPSLAALWGRLNKADRSERAALGFLAACFTLWALGFIYYSSFVASDGHRYFSLFDDAMISMRYAWNLSHGHGLVWNPGERIEGYTNLLMVLWMSLWTWLLDKPLAVLAVQLSGIPILLAVAALARLHWLELARSGEVGHGHSFGALAFLGALGYYPLAFWTLMGMETGLLTLLLVSGSLLALRFLRTGSLGAIVGSAFLYSLAYLTRPDSAPVGVATLAMASVLSPATVATRLRTGVVSIGIFLILPLVQLLFRGIYYGSLVPVTYILKATGMATDIRVMNGWIFSVPFLHQVRWLLVASALGCFLKFSRRKALLVAPPILLIAYQIAVGGDAWPYWRLVAPAFPYLLLLSLSAVDRGSELIAMGRAALLVPKGSSRGNSQWRISEALRVWFPRSLALLGVGLLVAGVLYDELIGGSLGIGFAQRWLIMGGVLVLFCAILVPPRPMGFVAAFVAIGLLLVGSNTTRFLKEAVFYKPIFTASGNWDHISIALSVNQYTTVDASVGVIWAGIVPYYTSRRAVDFLGKNDPYIASLPADVSGSPSWHGMSSVPGHNKYDLEYSIRVQKPTYVESFDWGSQNLWFAFEESYVHVSAPGPDLALRRNDPNVRWDLILPGDILDSAQD